MDPTRSRLPHDSDESEFNLLPLLLDVWRQRWLIGLWMVAVAVAVSVVAAVSYFRTPSETVAQVEFRLIFDGADQHMYPNGTPFSRGDLLSTSVLSEVYRINELDRYLPFEQFRDALFVMESNRTLEMLDYQYQARLADTRLPPVERSRIEAEFRQKRATQIVPDMFLSFVLSSRLASLPHLLAEKVLNDVLVEWARQVATHKGSLRYQLDLLTPNVILKDTLNTQTTLIRYDLLRRHVGRALAQLAVVAELPGASTIRVGEENFSVTDLRTSLSDLLEFQLNPLIRRRLIYTLSPGETSLNALYLEDRLMELRTIRETADTRRTQLQAALQSFTAESGPTRSSVSSGDPPGGGDVSTQLSDTFLDRLIDIAGQSGALEYRQDLTDRVIAAGEEGLAVDSDIAFYQETLRLLREAMRGVRPDSLLPGGVTDAFAAIQARVIEILDLTSQAYEADLRVHSESAHHSVSRGGALLSAHRLHGLSAELGGSGGRCPDHHPDAPHRLHRSARQFPAAAL